MLTFTKFLLATLLLSAASAYATKGGIGAVFGALIGGVAGKVAGKSAADFQTIESALAKMATQINKEMPTTLDKDTRADSMTPGPGRRFTWNYTIVTFTSREIDPSFLLKVIRGEVMPKVCSNADTAVFFKNGVTVGYSYRASDGVFIAKADITPRDCGYGT